MRTLIDIPEQQITELSDLCQAHGVSRAEVIRRAITAYVQRHKKKDIDAFGLWKQSNQAIEDGLQYQKKLRDEW